MNEWIDGWMNGLVTGWLDGWMNERQAGWIDGCKHVCINACTHARTTDRTNE